jgi:hypothetical protein
MEGNPAKREDPATVKYRFSGLTKQTISGRKDKSQKRAKMHQTITCHTARRTPDLPWFLSNKQSREANLGSQNDGGRRWR